MTDKEKGINSFLKHNFELAGFYFSQALRLDEKNEELQMLVMLNDFAKNSKEEALMLYDDYQIRLQNGENKKKLLEKIVTYLEEDLHFLETLLKAKIKDEFLQNENTIGYDDFKNLIQERGNFKKTFEDIMFSTKVLISDKEDFINFVDLLIENNFIEMSLNYIESASKMFPNEERISILLHKALQRKVN